MKAVILAGGVGTRLWPVSTQKTPKQFQKMASNKTMLQETLDRIDFLNAKDIYIATNAEFEHFVNEQAPNIPKENIILEPALRDTATCICYAAMKVAERDPDEVMAIIYADHYVKDKEQFRAKLEAAEKVARDEHTLNIIEVEARFPNVNLGYVQVGKKVGDVNGNDILEFKAFTEKPDLEKAQEFEKSGDYLWNTGMYVWRLDTILDKYKKHLPDTYEKLGRGDYEGCEKISIDYAIMEKVDPSEVKIIPADFGWSDVGTWESVYDELAENKGENLVNDCKHINIETKGSLIRSDNPNKIIATIGLEDFVVVDTKDALLICPKNRSQDVKKIVNKLK